MPLTLQTKPVMAMSMIKSGSEILTHIDGGRREMRILREALQSCDLIREIRQRLQCPVAMAISLIYGIPTNRDQNNASWIT
jgi:hypothetical protein